MHSFLPFSVELGCYFCRIFLFVDGSMSPEITERKKSVESPISPSTAATLTPIEKIRKSLSRIEKRRNETLLKDRIIGRVSDKKPDLASDLVKIKSRRVNFKYLLGNKIGNLTLIEICIITHRNIGYSY